MTKLFNRVVEVITGDLRFNNTDLDIEFNIPFDDDLEPNLSDLTIYNLSSTTRNKLKRGQLITVNAGYKDDKGVILSGYIDYVTSSLKGTDRSTLIKVIDSQPFNSKKTLQKSFKQKIKADQLIRELAKAINLKIAVIKLPNNIIYKKGFSIDDVVIKKIQDIAKDCGASAYISRSQAYIRSIKDGDNHRFVLNSDTGLVESPEYFEEEKDGKTIKGYKAKSLLQYRMNTASIIELQSVETKSKVRVRKGKHICNGSSFYTEVEAIL
ncbi:phage protein [Psychrobacillus psychrotolerans]|uniref:phage protein n=1 Tax=Psychrobacillus psychrotolerans TaxID=126156 RepID=UPI003B01F37C